MSIISTYVAPTETSWVDRLADHCRHAAVGARTAIAAVVSWARSRVEAARADERGLETAEIVLIGSVVLVAVAAIAAALVTWLQGKTTTITGL